MEKQEILANLVAYMVLGLVDDQESVKVETRLSGDSLELSLIVADGDIGKVIGKNGRTARSLRTILGAASMKHQLRCNLNIVETDELEGKGSHAG